MVISRGITVRHVKLGIFVATVFNFRRNLTSKLFMKYLFFLGTVYGQGVYFAVDANYSSHDTYSPKDENDYKYIYISLVLTGEYTEGRAGMKVPPPKNPSQNTAILYDSLVDSKEFPQIFVAVKDNQAYPQYLVVCKMRY